VIVPIEAAALAGTLGGIAEITRSVFGDGPAGRLHPRSRAACRRVAAPNEQG
jgi:hypothetical protein